MNLMIKKNSTILFVLVLSLGTMHCNNSQQKKLMQNKQENSIAKQVEDKVLETVGNVEENVKSSIENMDFLKENNISKIIIHKYEDLPEYLIVFAEKKVKTWLENSFVLLDTSLLVINEPRWVENSNYDSPIILDLNGDGIFDVVLKESDEGYGKIYIYISSNNTLLLALESNPFEHEFIDLESGEYISNEFLFENLDKDKELELKFKYMIIDGNSQPSKNVIFDLKNNVYKIVFN